MNKVILIGNLTRDPELTETSAGTQACRFSLAVRREYVQNGERGTDFVDCVAWRGLAENIARYNHKGDKLAVEGKLEIQNYEDRNGNKRVRPSVQVSNAEFLSKKPSEGESVEEKHGLQSFDDDGDIPF